MGGIEYKAASPTEGHTQAHLGQDPYPVRDSPFSPREWEPHVLQSLCDQDKPSGCSSRDYVCQG